MEGAERRIRTRVLTRSRKPFSDRTNTLHSSSSSSSLPLNPSKKPNLSSSSKASNTRASAANASTIPSSRPPSIVSAPSLPKTSSPRGTVSLETSVPTSVVDNSQGSSLSKAKDTRKSVTFPVSCTPVLKNSDTWQQIDGVEGSIIKHTSATNAPSILDNTSWNPSIPTLPFVSAPSLPITWSSHGTFGPEASDSTSVVLSRGSSSTQSKDKGKSVAFPVTSSTQSKDKGKSVAFPVTSSTQSKDKGKSVAFPVSSTPIPKISDSRIQNDGIESSIIKVTSATNTPTILNNTSLNPASPPPSLVSAPSSPKSPSRHGSWPISVVYSRSKSSRKRKDKGKSMAFPVSSTPVRKFSDSRQQCDGFEGSVIPKAKALTVPCRKKRRAVSSGKDTFKDPLLQNYIEKQKAYFKMIDEFELSEEEVEKVDELD